MLGGQRAWLGRGSGLALLVAAMILPYSLADAQTTWLLESRTSAQAYRHLSAPGEDGMRAAIDRMRIAETLHVLSRTRVGTEGVVITRGLFRLQGDPEVQAAEEELLVWTRSVRQDVLGASVAGSRLAGGMLDFELGRMLRFDSLGLAMVDGASVDVRLPWHVGVGVHAGLEPTETRDAVTWNPFRLDGFREETDEATTWLAGASLFAHDAGFHAARLDFREWRDTDGNTRARQLAGSVRLAWPETLFLDSDVRWDAIGLVLGDLRGRIGVPISDEIEAEARYIRTVPIFDTWSIFSVFPQFPIQDASVGIRWRPSPEWLVNLRGSTRVVEDARGADEEPGGHLSVLWRGGARTATLSVDHYGGATARWDMLWLEGSTPVALDELRLGAALTLLSIDDTVNTELNTFAYGAQLSLDYAISRSWALRAFVENHETRQEKHATRGLLTLRARFGGGGAP